ncbi:hypothetical protein [Cohnella soli]|uniref:HEAT repeat domain-containing protein n=1 Tax=Cohnella soli TaxID=425005 RepID=A0ABW0I444_9BACL
MEKKDYQRVLQLAEEGERLDKGLPGLLIQWKTARYEAYRHLSLKNEQKQLAKEFLLGGDYAYYPVLESLTAGDKEEFYKETVAELKKGRDWRAREVYLKLISDKNDLAEMLAYVRTSPSAIEGYADRLAADYREEVERIYRDYIYKIAGSSNNRKEYQQVGGMLRRYQKVFGKESQSEILLQLRAQYHKKSAFLDELSKV